MNRNTLLTVVLIIALPISGYYIQHYSVTASHFVPEQSNSTLEMHQGDWSFTREYAGNNSRYRVLLDANATLHFGLYKFDSPNAGGLRPPCNVSGQPVFVQESTRLNVTISPGAGYIGYALCNLGNTNAYGTFQLGVLRTSTTQPYYSLGSFLQFATFVVALWGFSLLPEQASPRSSGVGYFRAFRWIVIAPAVILVASTSFAIAAIAVYMAKTIEAFPLVLAAFLIIEKEAEILFSLPMLLLLVSVLSVMTTISIVVCTFRLWIATKTQTKRERHRVVEWLCSSLDAGPFRKLGQRILPDKPQMGAFVRLGVVSLFITEILTISPAEFLRSSDVYLDLLLSMIPSRSLMLSTSIYSIVLALAMSALGLFAFSLKWKPSSPRAFRSIGNVYALLFPLSLVFLIKQALSGQDYTISFLAEFTVMLPFAMASAYGAWILESALRHIWIYQDRRRALRAPIQQGDSQTEAPWTADSLE